jgi:hypothetical protein
LPLGTTSEFGFVFTDSDWNGAAPGQLFVGEPLPDDRSRRFGLGGSAAILPKPKMGRIIPFI